MKLCFCAKRSTVIERHITRHRMSSSSSGAGSSRDDNGTGADFVETAVADTSAPTLVRIKVGKHEFRPFAGSLKVLPCDLIFTLAQADAFSYVVHAIPLSCWTVHILADENDPPNAVNAVAFNQPIADLVPVDSKEVLIRLFNRFVPSGPPGDMTEYELTVKLMEASGRSAWAGYTVDSEGDGGLVSTLTTLLLGDSRRRAATPLAASRVGGRTMTSATLPKVKLE